MAFRFCFAILALASSILAMTVESRDEQPSNEAQTALRIRLFNDSGDSLRNVELRYFLSKKKLPVQVERHHPSNLLAEIVKPDSGIPFMKILIPTLPPGIFPDSGGLSLGLHFSDWSNFAKNADYSYPASENFSTTEKIAIYINGEFVQGILPGTLPDAAPISLPSSSGVSLSPGEKVHFAWREVDGAKSYRLNVLSAADSATVFQKITEKNQADAALDSGEYLWRVESSEYGLGSAVWEGDAKPLDNLFWQRISVFTDTAWILENKLDVTPLAARKDTRLLDVKWGEMAFAREWDEPHLEHSHYDEEESDRCWAVGAQALNHYYGGNISQDEIKLKFKGYPNLSVFSDSIKAKILGAFLHSAQGRLDDIYFPSLLLWVLNENASLTRKDSLPSETDVKTWINAGIPLYVWTERHVMILDAYRISLSGRMDVRLLNTDNDGTVEWRVLKSLALEGFIAANVNGSVRMSDARIHTDSDGDGMMDYDEIERFGTNPENPDSDGDGINDKTEVFSYMIRDSLTDKDSSSWKYGITQLTYADIDGDSLRAELDWDSDGGGKADGAEDKNKNGLKEDEESDVYDADDDFTPIEIGLDVPGILTLYAREHLSVNDGVRCHQNSKNCDIASESKDSAYAVSIGRSAYVRRITSKGGVFFRDYATVTGNVRVYSLPGKMLDLEKQNNVRFDKAFILQLETLWPYRVAELPAMQDAGQVAKEIAYNESYTLKDGDHFQTLKVHSGGTLFLEPGEMYIGNIQLESGSKVLFIHPGMQTILHLNGSVIWRARTLNDDLEKVARGFKLIQYGSETMTVEGMWAGTIFAPNADLVLGQSSKKLYGRFLGKNVTVHQYAQVYGIPFAPEMNTVVARRK